MKTNKCYTMFYFQNTVKIKEKLLRILTFNY